jgi:hypothetical protein
MIPLVLLVLCGLITLVWIMPPAWIRALCGFTPTVRQRTVAGVLGACIALVGAFSASPPRGDFNGGRTSPDEPILRPPHSLNKRMDDEIQKAWTELKDGRIAYEPSRTMTEGTAEIVRVRIARGESVDSTSNFSDKVWVERLKTSAFMTAVLVAAANDFDVKELSSESRGTCRRFHGLGVESDAVAQSCAAVERPRRRAGSPVGRVNRDARSPGEGHADNGAIEP